MKSFKNLFAAFLLVIFAFTFTSKAFAADKTVKVENNYAIKSEDKKSNPKMVNETVTVKKNPQKVVVYDLGALDTITALGKEKNVVAIPKSQHGLNMLNKDMKKIYSAKKYQNAGSLFEPDFDYNLGLIYEIDLDEAGFCKLVITFTEVNCGCVDTLPAEIIDSL
ncbi:hypothetical protein LGW58_09100, partial [Streptococcus mutans]|nr:hypothetical protein [Streptococcus mutans]